MDTAQGHKPEDVLDLRLCYRTPAGLGALSEPVLGSVCAYMSVLEPVLIESPSAAAVGQIQAAELRSGT